MPSANRCPECRETIHPFAATCPSCGADLDAHRRQRAARSPRISLPRQSADATDLIVVAVVLLLLAFFSPLFGALLSLFIVWHGHHNSLEARRNLGIAGAALAIFNLLFPLVLLPHFL